MVLGGRDARFPGVVVLGCDNHWLLGVIVFGGRGARLPGVAVLGCTDRWLQVSQFVFNCYWHCNIVFLRDNPGKPVVTLHSKEGSIQGDIFGGQLFAVTMMPLCISYGW